MFPNLDLLQSLTSSMSPVPVSTDQTSILPLKGVVSSCLERTSNPKLWINNWPRVQLGGHVIFTFEKPDVWLSILAVPCRERRIYAEASYALSLILDEVLAHQKSVSIDLWVKGKQVILPLEEKYNVTYSDGAGEFLNHRGQVKEHIITVGCEISLKK